jgi:DNA-binding IclR family transcriptional regulator
MRYDSHVSEPTVSAVGVLDKAVAVLGALEAGPHTLAELIDRLGFSRATTHRLAQALCQHELVRRDDDGRYVLGTRLIGWGRAATAAFPLAELARPILVRLRDDTGESVQLYVAEGSMRRCVVALDSPHELRTIVEPGALLPLDRGSAGRILSGGGVGSKGWTETVGDRQAGVASVSAPVSGPEGELLAAVSVSGPIDRIGRSPGKRHGAAVRTAAAGISALAPH